MILSLLLSAFGAQWGCAGRSGIYVGLLCAAWRNTNSHTSIRYSRAGCRDRFKSIGLHGSDNMQLPRVLDPSHLFFIRAKRLLHLCRFISLLETDKKIPNKRRELNSQISHDGLQMKVIGNVGRRVKKPLRAILWYSHTQIRLTYSRWISVSSSRVHTSLL
jgi:hypothetical protein